VAGPLFFVEDLAHPVLSDDDHHHAERVLRLRVGASLTLSDGRGGAVPARWTASGPEASGEMVVESAPPEPALTVCFALVKGAKPELVVQKLCELGVDRIVPFVAERSVVRWDGHKADRAVDRLAAVARGAAMQSHRVWLPEVSAVTTFAEVAVAPAVLADRGGRPPSGEDFCVLVGPEGGWSDAERDAPLERVEFGRNVMRAETAAIAVGAIVVALREGLVEPGGPHGPVGG
jgi:16S rRNA (uracil1498-N3)-methyltransferase